MRILIVDDEEVLRDVLDAVLRREGFDVVLASTGEEALSLLDGDGEITVESTPGQGAEFVISLPRANRHANLRESDFANSDRR